MLLFTVPCLSRGLLNFICSQQEYFAFILVVPGSVPYYVNVDSSARSLKLYLTCCAESVRTNKSRHRPQFL